MRILYIEDDETISAMVKEMLEIEGWTVETIADGKEALAKISGDYQYHLMLIDYDLPRINGLEIVLRARNLAHRTTTPIVVLYQIFCLSCETFGSFSGLEAIAHQRV